MRAEVDAAISKHRATTKQTPLEILKTLTVDDWESEFNLIDLCLRESIRLQTVGAAFRKNISKRDVVIGDTGEVIPPGAFAATHSDDLNMNPDIYTNPSKFDPGRFLPDRAEDQKEPLAFAGWGMGRHPCCKFSI